MFSQNELEAQESGLLPNREALGMLKFNCSGSSRHTLPVHHRSEITVIHPGTPAPICGDPHLNGHLCDRPVPVHHAPVHHAPVHHTPIHHTPIHHAPIHHAPIHHAPIHPAPIHPAPIHHAPIHPAPVHTGGHDGGSPCGHDGSDHRTHVSNTSHNHGLR